MADSSQHHTNHNQHSDIHVTGIWAHFPAALHPAIIIMRLDRPIGWWLLLLPGWWSILTYADSVIAAVPMLVYFFIGAVVMRAAGCIINDLWDRDIDGKIARTSSRPIASGQLGLGAALTLLAILCLIGLFILVQLPFKAWIFGIASAPFIIAYPLFKRFTFWPQAMLGLTFSWGIWLGQISQTDSWPDSTSLWLYCGCVFWVIGYDTIYAIQDMADDVKIGVKSSALAMKGKIAKGVLRFYFLAVLAFYIGFYLQFGLSFWAAGWCAMAAHLVWQVVRIQEDDPRQALRLFKSNRDAGLLLCAGLLVQLIAG